MSHALKTHLFGKYGSFADKRIKKIDKGRSFIGDSRDSGGIASDGSLYGWFCGILVNIDSDDEARVTLSGNIPKSTAVSPIMTELGGAIGAPRVELRIRRESLPLLRNLAAEIDAIVAPGKRYATPSYKYMCPRTGSSLRELATYLEEFWG